MFNLTICMNFRATSKWLRFLVNLNFRAQIHQICTIVLFEFSRAKTSSLIFVVIWIFMLYQQRKKSTATTSSNLNFRAKIVQYLLSRNVSKVSRLLAVLNWKSCLKIKQNKSDRQGFIRRQKINMNKNQEKHQNQK